MARMTEAEWAEIRAEWEGSKRPGLAWLTVAGGGRWDITAEGLRKRRLAENWTKAQADMPATGHAHRGAAPATPAGVAAMEGLIGWLDDTLATDDAADGSGPTRSTAAEPSDADAEARARLLRQHQRDWVLPRAMVAEAARGRDAGLGRLAKLLAETLGRVQEGERRIWGLEADLLVQPAWFRRTPSAHGNGFALTRRDACDVAAATRLLREWTVWFRDWRRRGPGDPPPAPAKATTRGGSPPMPPQPTRMRAQAATSWAPAHPASR